MWDTVSTELYYLPSIGWCLRWEFSDPSCTWVITGHPFLSDSDIGGSFCKWRPTTLLLGLSLLCKKKKSHIVFADLSGERTVNPCLQAISTSKTTSLQSGLVKLGSCGYPFYASWYFKTRSICETHSGNRQWRRPSMLLIFLFSVCIIWNIPAAI